MEKLKLWRVPKNLEYIIRISKFFFIRYSAE
ncbi:MAG: hypothetical protein OD815_001225 [Candidatus Alkanophagales archaeon MCA70_species_2]|nr:hypothetical protein [Candidatus Alkanophaga liquidiphilum]